MFFFFQLFEFKKAKRWAVLPRVQLKRLSCFQGWASRREHYRLKITN